MSAVGWSLKSVDNRLAVRTPVAVRASGVAVDGFRCHSGLVVRRSMRWAEIRLGSWRAAQRARSAQRAGPIAADHCLAGRPPGAPDAHGRVPSSIEAGGHGESLSRIECFRIGPPFFQYLGVFHFVEQPDAVLYQPPRLGDADLLVAEVALHVE